MSQGCNYPIYRRCDNIFIEINRDGTVTACLIDKKWQHYRFDDNLKLSGYSEDIINDILNATGRFEECSWPEFIQAKNLCLCALGSDDQ